MPMLAEPCNCISVSLKRLIEAAFKACGDLLHFSPIADLGNQNGEFVSAQARQCIAGAQLLWMRCVNSFRYRSPA